MTKRHYLTNLFYLRKELEMRITELLLKPSERSMAHPLVWQFGWVHLYQFVMWMGKGGNCGKNLIFWSIPSKPNVILQRPFDRLGDNCANIQWLKSMFTKKSVRSKKVLVEANIIAQCGVYLKIPAKN